ncbi:MAG TPA: SGNH/GDSL hydrolase family protein [Bryobacteraceae bacterium]|nr:SGNH/GDSL hydrolase family protein [Bryobacteraceae bacterium]
MKPLLLSLCVSIVLAQQPQPPNPAFEPVQDTAGLPRVLLIGDSISIGYTLPVREVLRGKANVHRIPANGATTRFTLESIEPWLGSSKWDVIHVNWGLHDLKIMEGGKHQVPIEEYASNLQKLVDRLKQTGAKVIFATTTPVPQGKLNPLRHPADVPLYNAAALRVMKRNRIAVDDLYAAVLPKLKDVQLPENVHFTPEGSRFLAAHVVSAINPALSKK